MDPDRLGLVELDVDERLGQEIQGALAENLARQVDLVVRRRVHEVKDVAVAVEELHLALVQHRALDVVFRPELVVDQSLAANIAEPALDVTALVSRCQVVHVEHAE